MTRHIALVLLVASVALAACAATDASERDDAALVCTLTLTRVRCGAPCETVARQQTFTESPARGGCGGNALSGCLMENATGDLYSSPTTTYFATVLTKFQQCSVAQEQSLYAPAGSDGGVATTDDATSEAATDDEPHCHDVELTRVTCAGEGGCPPKTLTETGCGGVRNGATWCIAEVASGDLYMQGGGEPLENIAGRLRDCTDDEQRRWLDALPH